jgi:hypothetical protein
MHGYLATKAHGDAPLGAARSPASAGGVVQASDTGNVLLAATARWHAIPPDTQVVSPASNSGANRDDGLGGMSTSKTTAVVTVAGPLRGSSDNAVRRVHVVSAAAAASMHVRVAVDAVFADTDDIFGPITPI